MTSDEKTCQFLKLGVVLKLNLSFWTPGGGVALWLYSAPGLPARILFNLVTTLIFFSVTVSVGLSSSHFPLLFFFFFFYTLLIPCGKFGLPYPGKDTLIQQLQEHVWVFCYPVLQQVHAGSFLFCRNPPNTDNEYRKLNVRSTWSFSYVRIHMGVEHTDGESAQHLWLGKLLKFFLGSWRDSKNSGHGMWIWVWHSTNWVTPSPPTKFCHFLLFLCHMTCAVLFFTISSLIRVTVQRFLQGLLTSAPWSWFGLRGPRDPKSNN